MPKRADICSILVIGFVAASAFAFAPAHANGTATPNKINELSQAELNAMSDACHAPRAWLQHRGGDEIRFRPSKRARFSTVDCVLGHLKNSAFPMNFGFVGNETPEPEDDHK